MKCLFTGVTPALFLAAALVFHGCGMRPRTAVPADVTANQILAAVEKHSARIQDFSGNALVKTTPRGGSLQTVKLSIKYKKPDRYRILITGFAGIPIALIATAGDSVNVFFPSDNAFMTVGPHDNIIRNLIPGIDIEFGSMITILTGILPPPSDREHYLKSLERSGKRVILTLRSEFVLHRYTVEGSDLRVAAEEVISGEERVWSRKASGFREIDGVPFPRRISLENKRGMVDIEFSGYSINSGLADNDLAFEIPASAERVFFREKTSR